MTKKREHNGSDQIDWRTFHLPTRRAVRPIAITSGPKFPSHVEPQMPRDVLDLS